MYNFNMYYCMYYVSKKKVGYTVVSMVPHRLSVYIFSHY